MFGLPSWPGRGAGREWPGECSGSSVARTRPSPSPRKGGTRLVPASLPGAAPPPSHPESWPTWRRSPRPVARRSAAARLVAPNRCGRSIPRRHHREAIRCGPGQELSRPASWVRALPSATTAVFDWWERVTQPRSRQAGGSEVPAPRPAGGAAPLPRHAPSCAPAEAHGFQLGSGVDRAGRSLSRGAAPIPTGRSAVQLGGNAPGRIVASSLPQAGGRRRTAGPRGPCPAIGSSTVEPSAGRWRGARRRRDERNGPGLSNRGRPSASVLDRPGTSPCPAATVTGSARAPRAGSWPGRWRRPRRPPARRSRSPAPGSRSRRAA